MCRFASYLLVLVVLIAVAIPPVMAQQRFQKWDTYAGYAYLNTPTESLQQHGYNLSFGRNVNRWLALGADFSGFSGSASQALPVNSSLTLQVPYNASTYTFAAGTQFNFRQIKAVTPFFRPFLGAFHSKAEGKPSQIQAPAGVPPAMLQAILAQVPSSALTQSDTVLGYGAGAGVDLNLTRPIGVRIAMDYIRTSLFDAKQNNVRLAVGLIYRFGGDVERH